MSTMVSRKVALAAGAVMLVGALAGTALAGKKSSEVVNINLASRYARGDLAATRATSDYNANIGCYAYAYAGSSYGGWCEATNPANTSVTCRITDANMLQVLHGINDDSWIFFRWDEYGNCTQLNVYHMSRHAPKVS